jgi:hypothetical protein
VSTGSPCQLQNASALTLRHPARQLVPVLGLVAVLSCVHSEAVYATSHPLLLLPPLGANVPGTVVTLDWQGSVGATNYFLEVTANQQVVVAQWIGNFARVNITPMPDAGLVYFWRVAAFRNDGVILYSDWSWFTNGPSAPPGTTSPASPANGATVGGGSIPFRWSEAARASDYLLQVATDAGFTQLIFDKWVGYFVGITLTGLPDNGQIFYWRVAARNARGSTPFSAAWAVTNGPSAVPGTPALQSPANGATVGGTSIAFTWSQAARASDYFLQVAADAGFGAIVFEDWVGKFGGITLTGLPDDGQVFYWRVAARNALGTSPMSAAFTLTNGPSAVPETPAPQSPADGSTVPGNTVRFTWNRVPRATDYLLQIASNASFTDLVFDKWGGNSREVTLTGFPGDNQVYFWRVAARNVLGSSPVSAASSMVNHTVCSANSGAIGMGVLGPQPHVDSCFVDPTSGSFLKDETRRVNHNPHRHAGRMAPDASIRTEAQGVGLLQDPDDVWDAGGAQASGVDAHVYAGWVYDYLNRTHGLNGFDNHGSSMRSVVEAVRDSEGRPCADNAFWDGTQINVCVGVGQKPFSGALDVVTHEWGHAVTQYGAGLSEEKEPGALDEAFSDWLGTAIEHANGEPNWTMGEGIRIFRDLSNPLLYGHPATYLGAGWVDVAHCSPTEENDRCGVHTNSGVANKMFYLLSVGGTHNSITVTGIGIQQAIRIAIEANRNNWGLETTFLDARRGMIEAAQDLFGAESPEVTYVRQAWDAVRVYDPAPPLRPSE